MDCDSDDFQTRTVLEERESIEREPCRVLFVFDGDTLACDLNGNGRIEKPRESIRFLGIDAPETRYSKRRRNNPKMKGQDEPFAQEAKAFVQKRLLHKQIYLAYDGQKQDRFGRTLAFLYEEPDSERSINEELLEAGLVTTLFIKPNYRLKERFESVEAEARINQKGLWRPVK